MELLSIEIPTSASEAACDRVKEFIKRLGGDSNIVSIDEKRFVEFYIEDNIDKKTCCSIGMGITAALLKNF